MINDARKEEMKESYRRYILAKVIFIAILLASIFLISIFALTIGGREITFEQALEVLWNHITGNIPPIDTKEGVDDYTVWNVRLPRIAVAIVSGAGLAIGGAAMQSAVKNPLADPYTTGISSGAVFGVAVAMVMGFTVSSSVGDYGIVINAFIFGMIPAAVISILSRFTHSSPATMILAGVAMSYLFNAFSTLLLVSANTETLQAAYMWQIGTLDNVNWGDFPIMFVMTVIGAGILMFLASKLNLLTIGDASAKSLGLDPETLRIIILIILSMVTASIVGFIGIVGFVGLVSPHIVRLIMGADNRYVIPASALFGAAFLLIADLIAKMIIYPGSIAVGVVMSFIGAPIFLLLIIRSRKEVW